MDEPLDDDVGEPDDLDEDLVVDDPDDELEEDLVDDLDDPVDALDADDLDVVVVDDDKDVVVDPEIPARRRSTNADDEEEDEEDDPDDVEADLDTILKDRIASSDDLDDEDEEEVGEPERGGGSGSVPGKQEGEFTCAECFMIVHPRQFGRKGARVCPEGFDNCPSIALLD